MNTNVPTLQHTNVVSDDELSEGEDLDLNRSTEDCNLKNNEIAASEKSDLLLLDMKKAKELKVYHHSRLEMNRLKLHV